MIFLVYAMEYHILTNTTQHSDENMDLQDLQ